AGSATDLTGIFSFGRFSDTSQKKPTAELQEVSRVNAARVVKVQRRVVWQNAEEHVAEREEVRGVSVAVAVEVAEEAEYVCRRRGRVSRRQDIIVAAGEIAVSVE